MGDVSGDYLCYKWLGSENYSECILGTNLKSIAKFDKVLNNIITLNKTFMQYKVME